MQTIQLIGIGDSKTLELKHHLLEALGKMPPSFIIEEITDIDRISVSGVTKIPALLVNGMTVAAGHVPSAEDILKVLNQVRLYKAKLFQPKKILVPTDFSEPSFNAFRYAIDLAQTLNAKIDLVYVADALFENGLGHGPSIGLGQYVEETRKELQHLAEDGPDAFGKKSKRSTVTAIPPGMVKTKLEFGFPEAVLERLSSEYDLIIMGTQGRTGLAAAWFGSISSFVSKNAHCPVIVVPDQVVSPKIENIVYASNFESNDPEKLHQVTSFADFFDAQIHFVHVTTNPENSSGGFEKKLFELNYKYADAKKPFIFHNLAGKDPIKKLGDYAVKNEADLLVFVTHRRGLWQELLHKSATEAMVLKSKIPILVVHQFNDISQL